jgi:hypothetical protein
MAEEKEQTKFEEPALDYAPTEEGAVIDDKKLLRKIDLYIVPGLIALLIVSSLDVSNGKLPLSPSIFLPLIFI